jgi:mono/diheme cytochrome c family protein
VDFIRKAYMHVDTLNELPASKPPEKSAQKNVLLTPVIADMSLPMPLGLKGDPVKGGEFFMKTCATCHGKKGDGDGPRAFFINPPPRNFLLESSRQRLNRPVLFEAITNGRVGTNMPAWGKVLNNQEIANVAEFVFQHFINAPADNKEQENKVQGKSS